MVMNITFWSNLLFRFSSMIILGSIIASLAGILEKKDGQKRSFGFKVFCALLVVGLVYKLWGLWNYNYYRFMFQPLAEQMIFMRYCASITLRLVGLIIVTGVLLLKDTFRKALLLYCFFTLCFLYFKHPYYVFENIARYTEQVFLNKIIVTELTHPSYPWISLIFNYTIDIVFSGAMLYYFTRPKVREQFK